MSDKILKLKDKLLEEIERELSERGGSRIDSEKYDALKDLAEAEYYCKVVEAMGPAGYQGGYQAGYANMGYMPMGYGPMGYRDAQGRYARGYGDPTESVRAIMATATPEEKERVKAEIHSM